MSKHLFDCISVVPCALNIETGSFTGASDFWSIYGFQIVFIFLDTVYNKDECPLNDISLWFSDVNELKECVHVLVKEQQALATQTATTALSAMRLKQRLVILERYFIALNRAVLQENVKVKWKSSSVPLPAVDKKR